MPKVVVAINQWVVARRWALGPGDAAKPYTGAERTQNPTLAHSRRSNTWLVTSGLSGCIAVGLVSGQKFCLMHVSSACNDSNWNAYRTQLQLAVTAVTDMGPITHAFVGYSDEIDKKQPTYPLVWAWVNTLNCTVEGKNVGTAVMMCPSVATDTNPLNYYVSFDPVTQDVFTKNATQLDQAAAFITNSGNLA